MSALFKMSGKTPDNELNICITCRWGTRLRGAAESTELIHCAELETFIRFKVTECSSHEDKTKVTLKNLYEVAWILSTDAKKQSIGFTPYKTWKKAHKDDEHSNDNLW